MRFGSLLISAALITGVYGLTSPPCIFAQNGDSGSSSMAIAEMPEAPDPQSAVTGMAGRGLGTQQPVANSPSPQPSSSSQPDAASHGSANDKRPEARPQDEEQKKRGLLGVPFFYNASYPYETSLTPKQKINFALRSATYPVSFATALAVAGYREALGDDKEFGWGPEGYGKRAGAAYLDTFDGTMIGQGFLPILFHQDPRYFRLGYGSARHRLLYAAASGFICKHDKTGKWEPNYSSILGNVAAGGISNLYYTYDDSAFKEAISVGMIVTAEDGISTIFREFWPDVSRKLFHKDPTHGLDAQARAKYKAAKEAEGNRK